MKVFQVINNICYWDATSQFPTKKSTLGFFPPDLLFVEAPDYVFQNWKYINGEFIQPIPPDGYLYDPETGDFYPENTPLEEPPASTTWSNIAQTIKEGVDSV